MSTLHVHDTIGQLAADHPLAVKVFQRRGIDFCCGGRKPLSEVCASRGLDAAQVLAEIASEEAQGTADTRNWTTAGLNELIAHILSRHHVPLYEELARLVGLAQKVHRVHGAKEPERLAQLLETVVALREELEPHMRKEEQVLFPWIASGRGQSASAPIHVMRAEHEDCGELLVRLRALTDDFTIPQGACATWRALWQGLEALEADLMEHMHLENNILFPRALSGT